MLGSLFSCPLWSQCYWSIICLQILFSSSHKEMESISSFTEFGPALWLALMNKCDRIEAVQVLNPRTQDILRFHSCLLAILPWDCHVRSQHKPWRITLHEELRFSSKQVCTSCYLWHSSQQIVQWNVNT